MTVIHPVVVNVIVDCKIPKIAMFVNLTKKILKVVKKVRLDIIYECANIVYIMTDMFKALTILIVITAAASAIDPFISV